MSHPGKAKVLNAFLASISQACGHIDAGWGADCRSSESNRNGLIREDGVFYCPSVRKLSLMSHLKTSLI